MCNSGLFLSLTQYAFSWIFNYKLYDVSLDIYIFCGNRYEYVLSQRLYTDNVYAYGSSIKSCTL